MIWQLVKRDAAWSWMPWFAMASATLSVLWPLVTKGMNADPWMGYFSAYFITASMAVAPIMLQQGDTVFQAALPVTVRQVYLARVLAMLGLLWIPGGVTVATALMRPDPAVNILRLFGGMTIVTLVMVAVQTANIRGFNIPPTIPYGLGFAVSVFTVSAGMPSVVPLICWLALGGTFLWAWQTVPKSFQSAPAEASPASVSGPVSAKSAPANPWFPVLRTVFPWGGFWIVVPFFMMLLGAFRPYIFIYAAGAWQSARPRIGWLFALPVRRRALLSMILSPVIVGFAGGYLTSVHLPSFPAPYQRGVFVRTSQELPSWPHGKQSLECKTPNVLPTLEFWALTKNGRAPSIQSPWGETYQPPVFRKAGFDIFNPYAVGCDNSERFLDWQFSRASLAVYGRPLRRDKNEDWMIGHVVVTSLRTQFVNVASIAGFAMLAMIVALLNDWKSLRRLHRAVRFTIMNLAAVAGMIVMFLDALDKLPVTQWTSWALPQSLFGAVAAAILPLTILYWTIDTLFGKIEIADKAPAPRTWNK